jgi:hypothetical protein
MLKLVHDLGAEAAFDPETLQIMAAAFDRAWGTLEASGAAFVAAPYAAGAREILGKYIVQAARNGERDQQQLCDGALRQLAKSDLTRGRNPSQRPGSPE